MLAFRRGPFLCVANTGDAPYAVPAELVAGAELLVASDPAYGSEQRTLAGPSAAWFLTA